MLLIKLYPFQLKEKKPKKNNKYLPTCRLWRTAEKRDGTRFSLGARWVGKMLCKVAKAREVLNQVSIVCLTKYVANVQFMVKWGWHTFDIYV